MATPFEMTKDRHEAQWQTNYLTHWVLTEHLLPMMLRTAKTLPPGSVRIANLTSAGYLSAPNGGINFPDLSLKDAGPMARYGQSKLVNVLHTNPTQEVRPRLSQCAKRRGRDLAFVRASRHGGDEPCHGGGG